jgi:hypothetical protein
VPRGLTAAERTLLNYFSRMSSTVRSASERVSDAQVIRGCQCGCGTIAFVVDGTEQMTPFQPGPR